MAAVQNVLFKLLFLSNNDNEIIYSIDETVFFLQMIHISGDLMMVIVDCC